MSEKQGLVFENAEQHGGLKPFIGDLSAQEYVVFHMFSIKVFSNPKRYGFESVDEAAEAFIQYSNRIGTIVRKSIQMKEKSEAYLDVSIRFLAKSIHRSKRKKEQFDFVLESADETLSYAAVAVPPTDLDGTEKETEASKKRKQFIMDIPPEVFLQSMRATSKRLLYLVIKCSWELDDSVIAKAAFAIGVPEIWLHGLVEQARFATEAARICRTRIDEKINAVWVDMLVTETRIKTPELKPDQRLALCERLETKRHRYEALLQKKSRCKLLVPNRVIAELLHVPKGSVDSGLYYLRKLATR
jgi:hypothetical protein